MPTGMDFVADKNHTELARLSQLYEFPDFVKQADFDLTLSPTPTQAPVTSCADPVRQQFYCHTKAACWLSALWWEEKKAEFHPKDRERIEDRLNQYVGYWQIKEAVMRMRARYKDLHKEAESQLPDSAYGYVWVDAASGQKNRFLRMSNPMEVKVAAEYLEQHRDRLPFRDRHTVALKIIERANHFGVGLGKSAEFLERQAGRGVPEPIEVVEMIRQRAMLTKDAALREHFQKMAQEVHGVPRKALMPDMLVKLAETMDTLDRNLGLIGKYGGTLQRPEDVIFKATLTKVASEAMEHVATTTGKLYEKQAFKRLDVGSLRDAFGPKFVSSITTPLGEVDPEKLAEVVGTLPRGDAELFDAIASDSGIAASLTKAASTRVGLSREELAAWGQAYQTV